MLLLSLSDKPIVLLSPIAAHSKVRRVKGKIFLYFHSFKKKNYTRKFF